MGTQPVERSGASWIVIMEHNDGHIHTIVFCNLKRSLLLYKVSWPISLASARQKGLFFAVLDQQCMSERLTTTHVGLYFNVEVKVVQECTGVRWDCPWNPLATMCDHMHVLWMTLGINNCISYRIRWLDPLQWSPLPWWWHTSQVQCCRPIFIVAMWSFTKLLLMYS